MTTKNTKKQQTRNYQAGLILNCFYFSIFFLFNVISICSGATISKLNNSPIEDAEFWRNVAEKNLEKIVLQIAEEQQYPKVAKNIILFVGDGMGMASITAGRILKGQKKGQNGEEENLSFDLFPHVGLSKTYNVDRQVPDSAGTATALFSGVKTNSGVVGLDATNSPNSTSIGRLTTILDWAISMGKRTGFVTTTRLTHATPAALYAHAPNRDWECDTKIPFHLRDTCPDIARQLVESSPGNRLNVILAGGTYMMGAPDPMTQINTPKFNGSSEDFCVREDGRNLVKEWLNLEPNRERRTYVQNTGQLMAVETEKVDHLLGLFAPNHMSYSSQRDMGPTGEPSIAEMTRQAIGILKRDNNCNGFLLLVEGGRIDQAHHQNHARLALEEILEMDLAVDMALSLTSRKDTLVIVTADHSHSITMNGYPDRGNDILGFAENSKNQVYETLSYANGPGYWQHRLSAADTDDNKNNTSVNGTKIEKGNGWNETWLRLDKLNKGERELPTYRHQAMVPMGDETHGGEDIPVYAIGPGSQLVRGVFEQNYIGYVISYAACMGPARYLNPLCTTPNPDEFYTVGEQETKVKRSARSGSSNVNYSFRFITISITIFILFYYLAL